MQTQSFIYCYLHGFGSSANAYKGKQLASAFAQKNITLHVLDCNVPTFEQMTMSNIIAMLNQFFSTHSSNNQQFRFIGSSLGGLVAARYAELHPNRVNKIVLLCPAFHITQLWCNLLQGKETIENWSNSNMLYIKYGEAGHELDHAIFSAQPFATSTTQIRFDYYKDALQNHPGMPKATCPIFIIHGELDTQVPVAYSQTYVQQNATLAQMTTLQDDHGLAKVLPQVQSIAFDFFNIE